MADSKGRILIAEDDLDVGAVLALALRMEGYQVQVLRSAIEGRKFVEREEVDLLILDWLLVDGTADEVCSAARGKKPDIPIIVMSAVLDHETKSTIQCRPVHFMTKPLRIHVLTQTVASLLKQQTKQSA